MMSKIPNILQEQNAIIDNKSEALTYSSIVNLPTEYGDFKCFSIREKSTGKEHFISFKGEVSGKVCMVRIHSECLTGDIFRSKKCDCGDQLEESLKLINAYESGMLIYLRQEGRNIGLFSKLEAYKMQELGHDTVTANTSLGLPIDTRSYEVAINVLEKFAPKSINLITNNPLKVKELEKALHIPIIRVSLKSKVNQHNISYLNTKITKLNHDIELGLKSKDE